MYLILGKFLNNYLNTINDKKLLELKEIESQIIKKEQSLIAKQNIIEKKEFEQKLSQLSKEVQKYRLDKKKTLDDINKIKKENVKKILNALNPIVSQYVNENSISLACSAEWNLRFSSKCTSPGFKLIDISIESVETQSSENLMGISNRLASSSPTGIRLRWSS